jgi:Fe-Mn family superoxide dismutase
LISKKDAATAASSNNNKIVTKSLPYDYNALEPYISSKTMLYHHDKHYAKYVATTNQIINDSNGNDSDLISIMKASHGKNPVLFNNAAQSWNHEFYWKCMKPNGGGGEASLPPKLKKAIEKSFGSYEEFAKQFAAAGNSIFGSGWAWLVQNKNGNIEIIKTTGAENPIIDNKTPLLTMDIWEHAYYLDYQNVRATYVSNFIDKLVDWQFVQDQMKS